MKEKFIYVRNASGSKGEAFSYNLGRAERVKKFRTKPKPYWDGNVLQVSLDQDSDYNSVIIELRNIVKKDKEKDVVSKKKSK